MSGLGSWRKDCASISAISASFGTAAINISAEWESDTPLSEVAAPMAMVPPRENTLTRGSITNYRSRGGRLGRNSASGLRIKKQDRFHIEMHLDIVAIFKLLHTGNSKEQIHTAKVNPNSRVHAKRL